MSMMKNLEREVCAIRLADLIKVSCGQYREPYVNYGLCMGLLGLSENRGEFRQVLRHATGMYLKSGLPIYTAAIRLKKSNDGQIGPGFWEDLRLHGLDVPPSQRDGYLEEQMEKIHNSMTRKAS